MYSNLRSLIFKIDPERAHFFAIQSLKLNLVSNIFDENQNDPILKTKLFNKHLDNIEKSKKQTEQQLVMNPVWHVHNGYIPKEEMIMTFSMLLNLVETSNACLLYTSPSPRDS